MLVRATKIWLGSRLRCQGPTFKGHSARRPVAFGATASGAPSHERLVGLPSSSIMVPLWLHSGSILATFWIGGAPRWVPVPTDWTRRDQALRCWVRVRVGDGVVISWRVGHWRALGASRECPWNVPSRCLDRMFQIIMSRIMFYYVLSCLELCPGILRRFEPGRMVQRIMSELCFIMFYYVRELCPNYVLLCFIMSRIMFYYVLLCFIMSELCFIMFFYVFLCPNRHHSDFR